jgi:hypothetical protein
MPPHGDDMGIGKIDGVGAGLTAAGEEVRAEGLIIGAGEVGGEDAAGRGHAGKSGKKWRVTSRWLSVCRGKFVGFMGIAKGLRGWEDGELDFWQVGLLKIIDWSSKKQFFM